MAENPSPDHASIAGSANEVRVLSPQVQIQTNRTVEHAPSLPLVEAGARVDGRNAARAVGGADRLATSRARELTMMA